MRSYLLILVKMYGCLGLPALLSAQPIGYVDFAHNKLCSVLLISCDFVTGRWADSVLLQTRRGKDLPPTNLNCLFVKRVYTCFRCLQQVDAIQERT